MAFAPFEGSRVLARHDEGSLGTLPEARGGLNQLRDGRCLWGCGRGPGRTRSALSSLVPAMADAWRRRLSVLSKGVAGQEPLGEFTNSLAPGPVLSPCAAAGWGASRPCCTARAQVSGAGRVPLPPRRG